jgi:DNA-directed RNA polymerase beta subunit
MSNFNAFFKKEGAQILVNKYFNEKIDSYAKGKSNLTDLKFHVEEDNYPASYYVENSLTASFRVVLNYTVNYGKEVLTTYFEVPKEIDGAFIINGAYRIATNYLENDWDCRINMSGSKRYDIHFDYDRTYDIKKGVLIVNRRNPDLGYTERNKTYKLDEIDQVHGLERELLRLSERQTKKLMVKLDLDYTPYYITKQLIEDCIAHGDDKIRDSIVDKKISSISGSFLDFLFKSDSGKNFYKVTRSIATYWVRYSKLPPPPISYITNVCLRFFKGSSDSAKGGNGVNISTGINPINIQSITDKIMIPESVAYNASFSDLICVGATPINQNVNKQNALTVATHIKDDDVYFDVYNKEFKKITIPYLDYLNQKVVASEYVDYENNQLKPDKDGKVEVKHRMKRKLVPVEEIDLIDLHPDYRLSEEVRRIPFVNYTDSVRVHMGSSMLRQAIGLPEAERPLVDTGNSEELKGNVLNEIFRWPEGKVKEITNREVLVELPNKETVSVPRRTAIKSVNDVSVYTEPKVKVGQKVKQGDVIIGGVGLENDTYKSGLNALVLFHAMFGYVNEDALVVSESFSKRMCSYSIIDVQADVKYNEAIRWIAPIGTKVKSGDPILMTHQAVRLDEVNKALVEKLGGGLFGGDIDLTTYTVKRETKVPSDIDEAYISDVIIEENKKPKKEKGDKKKDLTFSHTSKDVIKEFENTKDRKVIFERYPEYIAADVLRPTDVSSLSKKGTKVVYSVRIRLIKRTNVMIGSKITNRFGGKGVVSKILPDELMPVMVDNKTGKKTTVEVVMNPYSTVNRKIPSVNMETLLGKIAHRIYDIVEERKGDKKKRETIMPLLEKYYPGRYDGMSVDDFLKLHEKKKLSDVYYFNVGSFSTKFTPELLNQWAEELGVEPQSKILMPTEMITDLGELKANLSEEEYEKAVKDMKGKYTEVKKPLTVGYMTLLQLYHIPTYSNKSTSSMFGADVNEFRDSPIMNRGAYRQTGQKIGEMELSAYLARNAKAFIESARGDTAKEDNQTFLNNLLGLGLTVTDDKGYKQGGSSLKERLDGMKVKFRLKNQK